MKTKFYSIISLLIAFSGISMISTAQTYFQKVYVAARDQEGQDILPTSYGGYLIAGYTNTSIQYDCDVYIIKTDGAGNMVSMAKALSAMMVAMSATNSRKPISGRRAAGCNSDRFIGHQNLGFVDKGPHNHFKINRLIVVGCGPRQSRPVIGPSAV